MTPFTKSLAIIKTDTPRQIAYGWASIIERDGRAVVDLQHDQIALADLEKAVESFMSRGAPIKSMHAGGPIGYVVESFISSPDKLEKMGLDPDAMPRGWWIGVRVTDPETWSRIERGELRAFSIGGRARRVEV